MADEDEGGVTIDEFLDRMLLINFDAYLRGHRVDRKGELVLTFGIPAHYRVDQETKSGLAELIDWGGYSFQVILTRERPVQIPVAEVDEGD